MFEVRVSRPGDSAAVDRLLEASYPNLMSSAYDPAMLVPALKLMTRSNPILLKSGTYYVAELPDGLVIGCGGWTHERPGTTTVEPNLGHVRHFGTHPEWIRHGVGRAIFRHCEESARAAGVRSLEAYSSLNAESFYRALRFKRIREVDIELQPQVFLRAVLMRCEL